MAVDTFMKLFIRTYLEKNVQVGHRYLESATMLVAASELTMLTSALDSEDYHRGYQTIALKTIPDSSKLVLRTTRSF